jgi:peptide/nickel transport system permease protein
MGRISRAETLGIMKEDFVLTAYAKGLKENTVIFKHVFRNALIPIVTAMGFQFAGLLGGAVIVESIFNLPGLGSLLVSGLHTRDFPLIQGTLIFTVIFIGIISVILDIIYALLDPRIKY